MQIPSVEIVQSSLKDDVSISNSPQCHENLSLNSHTLIYVLKLGQTNSRILSIQGPKLEYSVIDCRDCEYTKWFSFIPMSPSIAPALKVKSPIHYIGESS